MKSKLAIVGAVVALAGCGGGTTVHHVSKATAYSNYFSNHYSASIKMCENYFGLVNAGWTDGEIEGQLQDMGNLQDRHTKFITSIRWCYKNDD